jgi:transaldolase/glucose-6-phosphate isomerase
MTNPLRMLQEYGQSVWLDFLSRDLFRSGELKRLIAEDGLRGMTSNPSIFEKAIGHGEDYDAQIAELEAAGDLDPGALFERLAITDIQSAADTLRPVYDQTQGRDGYVSIEVSPYLAMPRPTRRSRRRAAVARDRARQFDGQDSGDQAGPPAIRTMIAEGVNINITLLFAQKVYGEVAEAYISGLEDFVAKGGDPHKVASVASFFVSRIDTMVDEALDKKIAAAADPAEKARLKGLQGKIAIANAKLAYQMYQQIFRDERWQRLAQQGAQTQRLLWASTGTKNKAYSDVLYVEELIGPTPSTPMPPATMEAFLDHGRPRMSIEEDVAGAEAAMNALAKAGISIDEITSRLVEDGVKLFAEAAHHLYAAVQKKRRTVLGGKLNAMSYKLPQDLADAVKTTLEEWRTEGKARRLWAGDASLWTSTDEAQWLGWLDVVDAELKNAGRLEAFATEVEQAGFTDAVLLGMGGSSLGPEVLAQSFGAGSGFPRLQVLDSTDPAQIRRLESTIDLERTLFIVSSKSGSTLEPNIFKQYFWERAKAVLVEAGVAEHFIAVTDSGSSLEKMAQADRFRAVFHGVPTIGGRYSVLSDFGMVPAAATGVAVRAFLERTAEMVRSCVASAPPAENPGVVLGAILGAAARLGRDKLTVIASPAIAALGAWLEQLLAESTGKQGRGIIPLDGEPIGAPAVYRADRLFAYLHLAGDQNGEQEQAVAALEAAGQPVVRITVSDKMQLGQEFFRWEVATAVAGLDLGIDPFDQPDVEAQRSRPAS